MDGRWMIHSLGHLEATVHLGHAETHRRIDDWARFLGGRITRLEARVDRLGKHKGGKSPWLQIAAMGAIALSSLMGLVKPEAAAAILRALLH